jgi:hypothetical protein
MTALGYRFRAEVRRRWRSTLAIALLGGLAFGIAMATAAGARRTASAHERMREATNAADVMVNPNNGLQSALTPEALRRVDGVERVAYVQSRFVHPTTCDDVFGFLDDALPLASTDGAFLYDIDRPNLVAGRLPDPDRADEIFVNRTLARQRGLEVGDRLTLATDPVLLQEEPSDELCRRSARGEVGNPVTFTVTGIGVGSDEVVVDEGFDEGNLVFTPAFFREYPESPDAREFAFWSGLVVLRPGTDVQQFRADVQALVPADDVIEFKTARTTAAAVQRAVRPQAVALAVFTVIVGIAGVLLGVQAITRRLHLDAVDDPVRRAIGLTRGDLFTASLSWTAVVAVATALVATVVAFALSSRFPIGPARLAEPNLGLSVDAVVFAVGIAAILVLLPLLAALPAWRLASGVARERAGRDSRVAIALGVAGAPPPVTAGVRHALERGRGRAAVPVGTTLFTAVASLVAVVAALVFSASIRHFGETPRLFGWNWDRLVSLENVEDSGTEPPVVHAALGDALDESPDVDAWAYASFSRLSLDGRTVLAIGLGPEGSGIEPTIASGRAPRAPDEIVLGRRTLDLLDKDVGDEVTARHAGTARRLLVVGQTVLPGLGTYPGADRTAIGDGAVVAARTLQDIAPDFEQYGLTLVELASAPGAADRLVADLEREIAPLFVGDFDPMFAVDRAQRPTDVSSYERVEGTPLVLAFVLAILAATAVLHALLVAVRSRRHELAVLRAVGFTRGQVVGTVCSQSATIAVFARVVGLPGGVVLGPVAWTALAESIGAVAEPVFPPLALLVVPALLLFSAATGVLPGRWASRARPATVLRAE